jgi:PhzF family phenazine biosynthesis protein
MSQDTVLRYAAFTDSAEGGNPAGVVLDATTLADEQRLALAKAVGYSETAFLAARVGAVGEYDVRYWSPEAEVPFCGHATIASAVALAERGRSGRIVFHTAAGPVPVTTRRGDAGAIVASLTSVVPHVDEVASADVERALAALNWRTDDLDPSLPPRIAYAGARHLILAANSRERLSELDYDFDLLKAYMLERDLTTVDLVFADRIVYHCLNPFPVGGVYEDPATGAAAAAFGAYLREIGRASPPEQITIVQGVDMGRPSRILVDIPPANGPITVTGSAVTIA